MSSDNEEHDHIDKEPSTALIPVHIDDIDRLNAIARHLEGLILLLEAGAVGDPAFAAVYSMLRPIDEQLQQFKSQLNQKWRLTTAGSTDRD